MPKKDEIEVEGRVVEALPNAMFKVEIDENHQVLAVLSGRIRMNFVRIVPGDKVRVVLSPYDLSRGRITWRVREAATLPQRIESNLLTGIISTGTDRYVREKGTCADSFLSFVSWIGRKAGQGKAARPAILCVYLKKGMRRANHESTRLSETALRPLQSHPAQSCSDGDL